MNNISKVFALPVIVVMLASCGGEEKPKSKPQVAEVYRTMTLQPRCISGSVRLPGVLQPFQFVKLFPKVNGFVKSVYADRGSIVKQGQLLLTLEAPEIEQQVAAAKLKYSQAEAAYMTSRDRYRRLLETSKTPGTVAQYDIEAAAAKMHGDSATAQGEYAGYKAQEAMRGYLSLTAPFDGVITERNVHPGALVGGQSGTPMMVLQQLSKLRLVADVPEQYATQVTCGEKVHYTTNALPGKEFEGTICRSSQSLNEHYRAEAVEVDVPNSANTFRPGMYAEVELPTSGNANAFVVPASSVVTTTEKKYVVAVSGGLTEWIDVSEGNEGRDSVEIFGKLKPGMEIVTNAGYQIKNGTKIK